jgi:class 3 adenylate cyclase
MYALTGERAEAVRLAREVRTLCTRRAERNDDLWLSATLGEASLLLGENGEAEHWYRKAAGMAGNRHGDMASMRRQVRLVAAQFPTAARLLDTLRVPRVAICTGHMIDAPDRAEPRFPKGAEPSARDAIARALAEENIGFGYSSAASGADILFAECMLERGAELNIVLPFHRDDFIRTSVAAAGPAWVERFEKVLAGATRVSHCVNEGYLGDDVLFDYAAELTQGLAALRSEHLETEAVMIALADVGSDEKLGGTLGSLRRWQNHGRATRILDLRELRSGAASGSVRTTVPLSTAPAESAALPWGQRQIRTMLFADVVGYSRLREEETPRFFVKFLGAVEREIQASATRPAFGNTWGDGLYLVFDHPGEGADFALRLRDAVATTDWASAGLPADLSLRIGMHTGPVFRGRDPIIRQESFFGAHVTRTARIEPVAAPGSVYLSEQMAAALAAAGETRFACDYLGALLLAKQFGTERLYRLRRTGEAD